MSSLVSTGSFIVVILDVVIVDDADAASGVVVDVVFDEGERLMMVVFVVGSFVDSNVDGNINITDEDDMEEYISKGTGNGRVVPFFVPVVVLIDD